MPPISAKLWRETTAKIGQLRSGYIESTIQIESRLDHIIEDLITPKTGSEPIVWKELVRTVILQDVAVSYVTKVRILRRLMTILKKDDWPDVLGRLKKVAERRNKMAHWESTFTSPFDDSNRFAFTNLKADGTFESEIIDDAKIADWHRHANDLEQDLLHIWVELNPWLHDE